MAVTILGTPTVADFTANATSFSTGAHTVTAGTDTLLMVFISRILDGAITPSLSATWNSVALTYLANNFSPNPGTDDVVYWIGALNAPATGTQTAVLTATGGQECGGTILLVNLDGNDTSVILGARAAQSHAATSTASVSLSITPQTSGGLAIVALGISLNTTFDSVSSGFTLIHTGLSTTGNNLRRTLRYKAAPSSPETVSGTFGAADTDIGGVLFEIRSATTTFAKSATVAATAEVSAGVSGASKGEASSATWLDGIDTWTATLVLQADDIGVRRSLVRVGNPGTDRWSMERTATNVMRCRAIMSDGAIEIASSPGSLTVMPSVMSWMRRPSEQAIMVDGLDRGPSLETGTNLTGPTALAGDPMEIGATSAPGLAAYSGLMARLIVDSTYWELEQRQLFQRSILRPELVLGWGGTDARIDTNHSPIALPVQRSVSGATSILFRPDTIDPDGTQPTLAAVGSPSHGTAAVVGDQIRYTPTSGYLGADGFTYTINDGQKSSTSWVEIDVASQGLVAVDDPITVAPSKSVTFNPKANDTGARGTLVIVALGDPSLGTASLTSDNRVTYLAGASSGTDSFSYTIDDGFSQAVGEITATVTASPVATAVADSVETPKGTAVDISVLANDSPSGVVVDAITVAPAHGTTSILTGGPIRYTPTSGYTGSDSFTYRNRLPSTGSTATAACSIIVRDTVVAGRPQFAPVTGTVKNATSSNLRTKYDAASAGDQIILEAGNYGAFNFDRNFPDNNPVIIRSASGSPWSAIFTGTITLSGGNHWLYEIKTQQPSLGSNQWGIRLNANRQTITRCWINNANGISPSATNRGYIWIGWNRFTGQNNTTASHDQIYFSLPGQGNWKTNTAGPHQLYIYRNFFWDDKASGPEDHSVYFGETKAGGNDIPMMWEVYFEENFWHLNCKRNRILYLKRGAIVMYNHCNAQGHNWGTRHGMASKWWGNRSACDMLMMTGVRHDVNYPNTSEGPWPSAADGKHHDIRGNIMTRGYYRCASGSAEQPDRANPHQAAHYAVLVGNQGSRVEVGYVDKILDDREGGKIEGVKIYKAGKTISVNNLSTRQDAAVSDGDGGFAYPGDGTMRSPANYPSNGSEQGHQTDTQASAT